MSASGSEPRASRVGMSLFLVYVLFYAGFVLLSAFKPSAMSTQVLGVNLAIVYGFALIIVAFVLALIYMAATAGGSDNAEDRT